MRINQMNMPPLDSLSRSRERERGAGHRLAADGRRSTATPAEPTVDTSFDSPAQRDCTFAGIDSDLVRSKPLVAAIAREICQVHGGNEVLNWLEAEILLENALSDFPPHPQDRGRSQ